jgi:hypothetical protein
VYITPARSCGGCWRTPASRIPVPEPRADHPNASGTQPEDRGNLTGALAYPARVTTWRLEGEEPNLWVFLLCALALHLGLIVLARLTPVSEKVKLAPAARTERTIFVQVERRPARHEPQPKGDHPPGGGSPEPNEDERRAASVETAASAVNEAPQAVQDEVVRTQGPATRAEQVPEELEPEGADSEPDELFQSLDGDPDSVFAKPIRLRSARAKLLSRRQRVPATSPEVTASQQRPGSHHGYGPGTHGGPGGPGRGYGWGKHRPVPQVQKKFVFGGPHGAFRAEVCRLPRRTRALHGIRSCPGLAVFRTDHFNVPPRQFEQGFPGVSDRVEWFAIKYEGYFTTPRAGIYEFRLLSDDGSILYINGLRVIDHDGIHEPTSVKARVYMSAGRQKLKLLYFQGPRYMIALQLFVTPPGGKEKLLGPTI